MKKLLIVTLLGLFSFSAFAGHCSNCNSGCSAKKAKVEKATSGCGESGCLFGGGCNKSNNHK
jgi:hypothetical protein